MKKYKIRKNEDASAAKTNPPPKGSFSIYCIDHKLTIISFAIAIIFQIACSILAAMDSTNSMFEYLGRLFGFSATVFGSVFFYKYLVVHFNFPKSNTQKRVFVCNNNYIFKTPFKRAIVAEKKNRLLALPKYAKTQIASKRKRLKNDKSLAKRFDMVVLSAFLIVLCLDIIVFFMQILTGLVLTSNANIISTASGVHIVATLIGSAVCLCMVKVIDNNPSSEKKMLRGFFLFSGILSIIIAFFYVLYTVFKINAFDILHYVAFTACLIPLLALIYSIIIKVIKKSLLVDFDYPLFISKKRSGESVLDVVERHTGLSLKSLWSLNYIAKLVPLFLVLVAFLLSLSTCFYIVDANQQALVYRFGKVSSVQDAGLHFKLPWFVDEVEIVDTYNVQSIQIGYISSSTSDNLWTQEHDGGEYLLLTGNGNELLSINITLNYVIDDVESYLLVNAAPEDMLSAFAYEYLLSLTASTDLDTFLSTDRDQLSSDLAIYLNEMSDSMQLGLYLSQVIVESIHPPIDIADVYQSLISAEIQKEILITEATEEALAMIIAAAGEEQVLINEAYANYTANVSDAEYEMAVYAAILAAYTSTEEKELIQWLMYLDVEEKKIGNNTCYIFSPSIENLDSFIIGYISSQNE